MTVALPDLATVFSDVEAYYSRKVLRYGATPLGVDWACEPTQAMRFVQLLKLVDPTHAFSINDLGCGYGALFKFMAKRFKGLKLDYWGVDLSPAMIDQARKGQPQTSHAVQFSVGSCNPRIADYGVASGIFNVRLALADKLWVQFIEATLADMYASSRLGFAVNFLAPLPAGVAGEPELYRSPALFWQSYCETTLNASVTLVEGYGMREYTLLVRRV